MPRCRRRAHLAALQRAVVDGVQVELGYTDRDRSESERTVHPLGLVAKGSVWYLVAGTDAGMRTFRVNRIRSVTATDRLVQRPDGFDLAETWRSIVATLDERRTPWRVTGRADPAVTGLLRAAFGTRVIIEAAGPDGCLAFELRGHSVESVAAQLAGFADALEVDGPDEVRIRLGQIGAALVERYRP